MLGKTMEAGGEAMTTEARLDGLLGWTGGSLH
jgi:hypothetical protein